MSVIKEKLTNVLVVCCDAGAVLTLYLRPNSVHSVWIRFPQPPPSLVAARRSAGAAQHTPSDTAEQHRECEEARGLGGGNMLSPDFFHGICRVTRQHGYLRLVTDSIACARLAAAAAAAAGNGDVGGGHGDVVASGRARADVVASPLSVTSVTHVQHWWISERVCVSTRRDPTPALFNGRQREGKTGADKSAEEHSKRGEMVLEEEVNGVHIYRQSCCDHGSFFGRMWQRRQGHTFLLRLRKHSNSKKRALRPAPVRGAAFYL